VKTGSRVEVQTRFDGSWAGGFILEEECVDETGRVLWRTVKRASDSVVLPERFSPGEIRRERHRGRSTWWY
jgi:hypothetical protein